MQSFAIFMQHCNKSCRFAGKTAELRQDPNDPTRWQVVPTGSQATAIVQGSPEQDAQSTVVDASSTTNPGMRRLRRVACTCPNCRDGEGK